MRIIYSKAPRNVVYGVVPTALLLVISVPMVKAQASLSLTPAVIMAKGTYGQSLTQKLTINNQTQNVFRFRMMAEDILVKDGKRVFVPAGEQENSIAATAVFSPKEVIAPPNTSASVDVTITIPANTKIRAIAAVFQATNGITPAKGTVGLIASMGTLLTFNLTPNEAISGDPVSVTLPTDTTNLAFEQVLTNVGTEPVVPTGVVAILNTSNKLMGKANFTMQRLLPGEKLPYHAEFAGQLKPGAYHALCTFQYAGQTKTSQVEFTIQ